MLGHLGSARIPCRPNDSRLQTELCCPGPFRAQCIKAREISTDLLKDSFSRLNSENTFGTILLVSARGSNVDGQLPADVAGQAELLCVRL